MKKSNLKPSRNTFLIFNIENFIKSLSIIAILITMICCNNQHYNAESSDIYLEGSNYALNADLCEVEFNTEEYSRIYENEYKSTSQNPLSTFSIDVDNASYSNVRRYINSSTLPPKDAVRIEEMINYFQYQYPQPKKGHPLAIVKNMADCPWNKSHQLVHIGIQGKVWPKEDIKQSNLVFLIDVSGSMANQTKLPLLKKGLKLLLEELSGNDKVAIVAYAGAAGLVLPSTSASDKDDIIDAFDNLHAGGSTAGGQGIKLAYKIAKENFIEKGNNRVILATDGDFNVGTSSSGELVRLIEEYKANNIYLTICGFGMGSYKDNRMEQISNAGNGNYFYIDNIKEAKKVFVNQMVSNMYTIAKDVKIQIEFNPFHVKGYRLIGYENRMLKSEDFNNDQKDAGELGPGHTVTALYEIIPADSDENVPNHDPLKYQKEKKTNKQIKSEALTLKLRYKPMGSEESILIEEVLEHKTSVDSTPDYFKFSSAVAGFGLLLRGSKYKGDLSYDMITDLAKSSASFDPDGYKSEFVQLVETASLLK